MKLEKDCGFGQYKRIIDIESVLPISKRIIRLEVEVSEGQYRTFYEVPIAIADIAIADMAYAEEG